MLTLLLSASLAASPSWVRVLPWDVKVRPPVEPTSNRLSAELSVARGECQAFQLWIAPTPSAQAEIPALTHGAQTLALRVLREGFIPVTTASNSEGATGLWPDPLVPLVPGAPLHSTSARPEVLYVQACPSGRQAAGRYAGLVHVTAQGREPIALPVEVTVEPFSIPATSSLPTAFGLSVYSIAKAHRLDPESPQALELLHRYAQLLLDHRLSAFGMSEEPPHARVVGDTLRVDFTDFDRGLAPFFEGTALPSGARFTTSQLLEPKALTDAQRVQFDRAVRDHFRSKHWPVELFFYAKDEPRTQDIPLVLQQSSRVRAAGGISVLVTSGYDARLTPAADIVCPVINCLFPRPGAPSCAEAMTTAQLRRHLQPTQHLWWYQSCMSHGCGGGPIADPDQERAFSGWASYMIDHPSTLNRAMGALAFANGVEGELYWDTVFAYQRGDPWQGLFDFGGNGDGTLLYPGTRDRLGADQPLSSLRLEHIREGLQDYEYLLQVSRFDPTLAHSLARQLAHSGYEIERDARTWDRVRDELAEALRGNAHR